MNRTGLVTPKRKKRGDDLGVDERIILKCILKTLWEGKRKGKAGLDRP